MKGLQIGELSVHRVEESCGPAIAASEFLVGLPDDAIEAQRDWLVPSAYDPASGNLVLSMHSWIVKTRHHTVLIDSCMGNGKTRSLPMMHMLDTPWLSRLADRGVRPEQVDFVMCTHLHADHVGWNTRLRDGRWVPTFPNARYLFSRREFNHWDPRTGGAGGMGMEGVFEDSILPCVEAGQVTLVDDGYAVDDALVVEAAPGHTEGNSIIRARSAGSSGLFTGDCLHTPLQIAYPHVNSVACEDHAQATKTRRRILEECTERGHLMLPAHFPPPHVGQIARSGDGFRYRPLAGVTF